MSFATPPPFAAWQHCDARAGFEVVFLQTDGRGLHAEGATTAIEDGTAWIVQYSIRLGSDSAARSVRVIGRSADSLREIRLDGDGAGRWQLNGADAPWLDGCVDVDLESSALTNAFPVRRLGLEVGQHADAPAAYVRASDLEVELLEQHYLRLPNDDDRQRYRYAAPRFGFECDLLYDASGLVLDYPGIAVRSS
jgi:hypothetical protein